MGQLTQPICSAPRLAICSLEGDWRSPGAAPHAGTRRHRRSIFRCTGCLWGAAMRYAGHGLQGNTAAVQQHCRRGLALAGQEQQACSTTRTVVRHFPCCSAALLAAVVSPASLLAGLRWCCQAGGDRGPQSSEFNQPFVFTMDLPGVAKHRVARKRIQSGRVRRLTRGNHHRTQCAHVHLRIKQGSPDGFAASPAGCHVDPTTRLPVC